jgi:hypothetical protein
MSTFTPNKNIEQPAAGSDNNTWSVPVNNDWSIIDTCFGGVTTINVTSLAAGNYTLTPAQYQPPNIYFTGTISATLNYVLPAGVGGTWSIYNQTSGPFSIAFVNNVGGARGVIPPQGQRSFVISDGTNVDLAQTAGTTPATPSAKVGLTAVTGIATTFTASDSAPALNQAIVPTWTGAHTFAGNVFLNGSTAVGGTLSIPNAGTFAAAAGATVTVPTASPGDNSGNVSNTAFVAAALAAALVSPHLTGVPTAPTAASGTSTTQLATTAFTNPAAVLAQDGYVKLASGLIIQWGIDNISSGAGTTVGFVANGGIAFPTAAFIGVCSAATSGATANVTSLNTTGITMVNSSSGQAVYWIALGN